MAAITSGIATSFSNTPQANDDLYTVAMLSAMSSGMLTEDSVGSSYTLNVMANDLGGAAKSLYSVDNGIEDTQEVGRNVADLLAQDKVGVVEKSQWGSNIQLTADGKILYTFTDEAKAHFNSLGAGEVGQDTFTYAIRMGNGAISWATVTVQIAGTNDQPTITGGNVAIKAGVVEDSLPAHSDLAPAETSLKTGGTFAFADPDVHDQHTATVTTGSGNTLGGTLQVELTEQNGSGQVAWSYSVDNAHVQFLGDGETRVETFTVAIDDGHGGVVNQVIAVTVTGTNDDPTITSYSGDGAVTEDASSPKLSASGTVGFADVDLIDHHTATATADAGNALGGKLSLSTADSTGTGAGTITWTYSVDNGSAAVQALGAGQTATEKFTVSVDDGHGGTVDQVVSVIVTGTNDDPTITSYSGDGGVTEDAITPKLSASGTVGFADVDLIDHHTATATADAGNTLGGKLSLSTADSTGTGAGTITWTYSVDNSNAAVQALGADQTATEKFIVSVDDGHGGTVDQVVSVIVTGTNDAPTITSGVIASQAENTSISTAVYTAAGHDVDTGDTVTFSLGGTDAGLFNINASTGEVSFKNSPNYEAPTDSDHDNVYDITVTATDQHGLAGAAQNVAITVTNVNDVAPTITGFAADSATPGDHITNDNTLVLSGTAEAGMSVTVKDGSTVLGTVVADGTGAWSLGPTAALNNGAHSFTAISTDGSNSLTSAAYGVTVDTIAPTVTGVTDNVAAATTNGPITFTATFSEAVSGVGAGSFTATNGTVSSVTQIDSSHYAVLVTPTTGVSGNVALSLVAGGATDIAGNAAVAANLAGLDSQGISSPSNPFALSPATVTGSGNDRTVVLSFSEALAAGTFTSADLSVAGGGSITSVTANSANTQFTIVIKDGGKGASDSITVLAGGYTDVDGNAGLASNPIDIKTAGTKTFPAGISGEAINMGLHDALNGITGAVALTISGVPAGWTFSEGVNNGDGTWTIQTLNPNLLTVTTPADFTGATVLNVNMAWTNDDGTSGGLSVADNVEAYAVGSPIFAISGDDNLTGSSGNDLFVFAQPIKHDTVYSFNTSADKIDLIGFTGFGSFADVQSHLANDAAGNAVLTLSNGETITVLGVDAGALTADNFVFDQQPQFVNAGTMTINDGALLPLGGLIENSGTIVLGSTGDATELEVLVKSATLEGGGHVYLSDNSENVIFGGDVDATLINQDNTISGAGQIGAGQMTLVNAGSIIADGTHALFIDTGSHAVNNSGTLQASEGGGLVVQSDVSNTGTLWANDGHLTLNGNVTGGGLALIAGAGIIEFGAASDENVTFDAIGNGTLKLGHSSAFTGSVTGMNAGDMLDFSDILSGPDTTLTVTAKSDGTGNTLALSDGTHTANVNLVGQYSAADFHMSTDATGGTLLTMAQKLALTATA